MSLTDKSHNPCHVCHKGPAVSVWGTGTARCQPCTDDWTQQVRERRKREFEDKCAALTKHEYISDLDGACPDDGIVCINCCPHDDTDHGICMECEADVTADHEAERDDEFEFKKGQGIV